jgi:RNA polymerase sigma-70 factor (ECF subfamily)
MADAADFLDWVTPLVREHRGRLARVARGEGLRAEDALDCVQEAFSTFLLLPQAKRLSEAPDEAAKLLTVVARNAARNRRRRHDRSAVHLGDETLDALPEPSPPSDELLASAEDYLRLHGCVSQLGEVQRRVVTLRLLEDVPGEDVAELLGLTPGHVAVLLHRAKQNLRECMECEE